MKYHKDKEEGTKQRIRQHRPRRCSAKPDSQAERCASFSLRRTQYTCMHVCVGGRSCTHSPVQLPRTYPIFPKGLPLSVTSSQLDHLIPSAITIASLRAQSRTCFTGFLSTNYDPPCIVYFHAASAACKLGNELECSAQASVMRCTALPGIESTM